MQEQTSEEEQQVEAGSGRLVYGIVRSGGELDEVPPGVAGARVQAVVSGDIGALVSAVEGNDVRATRQDVMSHARVLEHALGTGPVLPLRFGTVFRDEAAVVSDLLKRRHDELAGLLARLETAVELRVKGFYLEEQILREIVQRDAAIAKLRESTRRLPEGMPHPQQLRLGEAVAHALEAQRRHDADEIIGLLRPLAEDVSIDGEAEGSLAIAASFLVDRARVPEFDREMDELARRHEGRIRFKYLGPLPAHSFVAVAGRT
jgi:hypothetical protein